MPIDALLLCIELKYFLFQYEVLIDRNNTDIVHHILIYECNRFLVLNDSNLPRGLCNNIQAVRDACSTNIANGWAVGGEQVLFQ